MPNKRLKKLVTKTTTRLWELKKPPLTIKSRKPTRNLPWNGIQIAIKGQRSRNRKLTRCLRTWTRPTQFFQTQRNASATTWEALILQNQMAAWAANFPATLTLIKYSRCSLKAVAWETWAAWVEWAEEEQEALKEEWEEECPSSLSVVQEAKKISSRLSLQELVVLAVQVVEAWVASPEAFPLCLRGCQTRLAEVRDSNDNCRDKINILIY